MTTMSAACLPPIHGRVDDEDRKHPAFYEYSRYRANCSILLVRADGFKDWLRHKEDDAYRAEWTLHPQYQDFRDWMCATRAGARRCPEGAFPENFKFWLNGGRW
jgi:hypothetical protein